MTNLFKNIAVAMILCAGLFMTGISSANAACYNNAGHIPVGSPPVVLTNGLWCTQGGYQNVNGMNIPLDIGQPFIIRNNSGQLLQCSWKDRAASAVLYGGAGALVGAAVDIFASKNNVDKNRFAKAGALSGVATGATVMCDPMMVDDNDAPQVRKVIVANTPAVSTGVRTYGNQPTTVGGNTCSVLSTNGEVLADFLDASKNPKGVVVSSGPECQKARSEFRI